MELNLPDWNAALIVVVRDQGMGNFVCKEDFLLEAKMETYCVGR